MTYDTLDLGSFGRGMFRNGPRELIPQGGAYDITNGLVDGSGTVYQRGGTVYKNNAALGTTGLKWVWTGQLAGGLRTVYHNNTTAQQLAADDTTPANLSGASTPLGSVTLDTTVSPIVFHGMILFPIVGSSPASARTFQAWGGSRLSASYSTGTVAAAAIGDTVITGTGTTWVGNVDPGMLWRVTAGVYVPVASVDSNTQITLAEPTPVAGSGHDFFASINIDPFGGAINGGQTLGAFATVANKILVAVGKRVYVSPAGLGGLYSNVKTDFHTLEDTVRGIANIRAVALVSTGSGTQAISNVALDLTSATGDDQRRVEHTTDLILWGARGLATWQGATIAPCLDDIWVLDTVSSPVKLSGNITDLYRSYVQTAGCQPGQAIVFNNHYLLPILDSSMGWVDTLVCRLDTGAWTRFGSGGAKVTGFSSRAASSSAGPVLLGGLAGPGSLASRVVDATGFFQPSGTVKLDHDSGAPNLVLTTGDVATGPNGVAHQVSTVRARYTLVDAASDNPTLGLAYSVGPSGFTAVSGSAPEDSDGRTPYPWPVRREARFVRLKFTTSGAAASAQLLGVTVFVERTGRWAP